MPRSQEEEFELVLGNRQLLSLFFLVVVLFGVFFSFGYTVGFSRGERSETSELATVQPAEEPQSDVRLPDTLLEDAPKSPEPKTPEPTTIAAKADPAPVQPPPEVKRTAAPAAAKPKPVQKEEPKPAPPPVRTSAPAAAASSPSGAAVASSTHLQIAAIRVRKDAELYVQQLRSKGHPAAVSDQGDGWYRVLVGPFDNVDAAKNYQSRLRAEGIDSLLRKR